jgi:predicted amidohydrolase YtcJ
MPSLYADKVLVNGKIHVENGRAVSALAIYGERIAHLGSDSEIMDSAGSNTKIIDLDGRLVIPGFIDTHIHPSMAGELLIGDIDFKTLRPESISDLQKIVRKKSSNVSKGDWIRGWGYDEERFAEGRLPNRIELDAVASDNPVFIVQTCGHVATANSLALEIGGISKDLPDPKQGIIDRDSHGEPTGVLRNRAQRLVKRHLPSRGFQQRKEALRLALNKLVSFGVTGVHDAWSGSSLIRAYQELLYEKQLPLRVGLMPPIANPFEGDYLQQLTSLGIRTGFGNSMLRVVGVKVALDGMIRSETAALRESYAGKKDDNGLLTIDVDVLQDKVKSCHDAGIRVCIHAEGDRGIDVALDAIERDIEEKPIKDTRHRIEHFGICHPDQMQKMKRLDVIPSVSINFVRDIGEGYERVLGPDRSEWVYPMKSLDEHGIIASCNSDWPVSVGNPMVGLYSAVSRKTWKENDLGASQSITIEEALKAYTWNGAYASFEEDAKGSIQVGKLADLAVLDRDIFNISTNDLLQVKVDMTIVGGKVVYQRQIN